MNVKMPDKTMLLTGFETFSGEKTNPSALAVKEFLHYTISNNEGNKPKYIKITEDEQDGRINLFLLCKIAKHHADNLRGGFCNEFQKVRLITPLFVYRNAIFIATIREYFIKRYL